MNKELDDTQRRNIFHSRCMVRGMCVHSSLMEEVVQMSLVNS